MTTLQLTIAIAASFAFLTAGTTSRADDTTSTASTTALPSHPPVQSVAVQQRPASTTTTTAASYPTERQAEQTTQMLPNRALLLTGTTTFLVSYVPSVIVSAVSLRDEDKKLVIPVAGPWIDLEQRDCNSRPCGSHNDLDKALIITSGVAQAAGALFVVSSLFIPATVTTRGTERLAKPEVHVVPVSYAAGVGVGAIGRF